MTNLIPEKRVNKNGVVVTKHVRSTTSSVKSGTIPAPSASSPVRKKKVAKARTEPMLWDIYKTQSGASRELIDATDKYNPNLNYYFSVSDVEAYDVMAVVEPRNIIPLLASGIRNREDARAFLKENNLSHLLQDNRELAERSLERNIAAPDVLLMLGTFPDTDLDHPNYFDAMEANSVASLRAVRHYPSIPKMVLDGKIKLSDIKELGSLRIKAGGSGSAIIEQLQKMRNGEPRLTTKELGQVIDQAKRAIGSSGTSVNEAVRLADEYGAELVLELENPAMATQLSSALKGYASAPELLRWHDYFLSMNQLHGRFMRSVSAENLKAMFEAGVTPQSASKSLYENMSVQQIIGIQQGVEKSMSSGWL